MHQLIAGPDQPVTIRYLTPTGVPPVATAAGLALALLRDTQTRCLADLHGIIPAHIALTDDQVVLLNEYAHPLMLLSRKGPAGGAVGLSICPACQRYLATATKINSKCTLTRGCDTPLLSATPARQWPTATGLNLTARRTTAPRAEAIVHTYTLDRDHPAHQQARETAWAAADPKVVTGWRAAFESCTPTALRDDRNLGGGLWNAYRCAAAALAAFEAGHLTLAALDVLSRAWAQPLKPPKAEGATASPTPAPTLFAAAPHTTSS